MKHATEEELFAYRDGEAKGREAMAAHLKECAECRAELARLEEVFAALDAMPVPDPGEDYGARVWRQIAPRLPERPAPSSSIKDSAAARVRGFMSKRNFSIRS